MQGAVRSSLRFSDPRPGFVVPLVGQVAVRVARALWRVGEGVVRGAVLVKKTVTQAGKKEEDDDLDKW